VRADGGAEDALHGVAVLVGRAGGGEAGDRVRPVLGLDAAELAGDAVKRLVPGADPERAALADQRRRQPVARAGVLVREAALQAGVPAVGGAVLGRADRDDPAAARVIEMLVDDALNQDD